MPWVFDSLKSQMRVKTGEQNLLNYVFTNTTNKPMIAQAIPSVSPGKGAQFFHKTECFCFEQQFLEPGESITIPLKFVIDPDLPKDISSLALGYTLFDITKDLIQKQASN
jgi:cytochrome c oxidase assembly protein subunit 11